jgi:hypothetical protein
MTSPMNDDPFTPEELDLDEALDWLFGALEVCECDPPENEWQIGYEAALRDMVSRLIGRGPSDTLH